jgi:hypothetical protein
VVDLSRPTSPPNPPEGWAGWAQAKSTRPANWPTWGDQLLQLRTDHPDLIPAQLVNLLQSEHGITTNGRTVAKVLQSWDELQEVAA